MAKSKTMVTNGKRKKVSVEKGRPLSSKGERMPYRKGSQSAIRKTIKRATSPIVSKGGRSFVYHGGRASSNAPRGGTLAERRRDVAKEKRPIDEEGPDRFWKLADPITYDDPLWKDIGKKKKAGGPVVEAKIGTSISKLVKSLIKSRPKPKKETMPIPQMKPKPKTKKPEAPVKPKIKKPIDAAAKQFMPKKPVTGMGINRRRPKSKIMKLQQDYEALTPSAKRAERAKGQNSRFYLVFKKLGMTTATPTVKKRHGGMSRVGLEPATEARAGTMSKADRLRYRAYGGSTKGSKPISTTGSYGGKKQLASWKSGLSADQIKEILGITTRDPSTGIKSKLKTPVKKKKVVKARNGGQVKRISHKQLDGSKLVDSTYDK